MSEEILDAETRELAQLEKYSLVAHKEPKEIINEAKKAATELRDVIQAKASPVIFNGKQYLEQEDWQIIGSFYQCAAKITRTEFVQFGEVQGFEAYAELVHLPSGAVVSTAEGMCLNDEDKWRSRAKYEYQYKGNKKVRVKVGEEAVPLFQLRSMAQTRALSKVHKNVFSRIAVLAGFEATPAEEVDQNTAGKEQSKTTTQPPKRKSEVKPPPSSDEQKREDSPDTFWVKDFNGKDYLWAVEGEKLTKSFLETAGLKESKTAGKFFTTNFNNQTLEAFKIQAM